MTTDTNELILAAHVRVIAQEKRLAAFQAASASVTAKYPELTQDRSQPTPVLLAQIDADSDTAEQRRKALASLKGDWYTEHPLEEFVPAAIAELKNIATLIRAHQTN